MEHQVFVPVPPDDLRAVLRDPVRVARCVPGLQQDADAASGPLSGRLKVRVGGHTVTYRGALIVTERTPGRFTADGEGTEVRGHGTVTVAVELRMIPADGGTRLEFTAEGAADGRAAAFTPGATATAVRRLLDRTAEQLAAVAGEPAEAAADGAEPVRAAADDSDPVAEGEAGEEADAAGEEISEVTESLYGTDAPAPSPDPFLAGAPDEPAGAPRPPAEAAHARRTMIGRSAEEVDHAPPRGRYAPVPAPSGGAAGDSLRWLAPAAALAVASAVVLGRALRRRR
ncbi:SRPBCC domain-containing protein [Streptomyces sp. NPDC002044]|uniref:SRPBCC family protein n=1 Tax=Streptomyces sp. NPDC002044 TaxID=3154662 RepID=UPI00333491EA